MTAQCFLDTGVLVHAVSSAPMEAGRKRQALALLQRTDFGLSAEVLQEFFVTVTQRIRRPLRPDVAVALLDEYRVFPVVPTDHALVVSAVELSLRHGLAYRDACALAAARALGATTIYSASLPAGREFEGVRVVNPFVTA
jgi:predicted nucleic acid-binding protein